MSKVRTFGTYQAVPRSENGGPLRSCYLRIYSNVKATQKLTKMRRKSVFEGQHNNFCLMDAETHEFTGRNHSIPDFFHTHMFSFCSPLYLATFFSLSPPSTTPTQRFQDLKVAEPVEILFFLNPRRLIFHPLFSKWSFVR